MISTKLTQLIESVLGRGKTTNKGNIAHHCPFCQSSRKKLEVQSNTKVKTHGTAGYVISQVKS